MKDITSRDIISRFKEYANVKGYIPHGNKSDEGHAANKTFVSDELFGTLFD